MLTFAKNKIMSTLTRIGSSWGLIIPAKIIKKRKYNKETNFDITEDGEKIIITPQKKQGKIKLPTLKKPIQTLPELNELYGTANYTEKELNNDPRLKAIIEI